MSSGSQDNENGNHSKKLVGCDNNNNDSIKIKMFDSQNCTKVHNWKGLQDYSRRSSND